MTARQRATGAPLGGSRRERAARDVLARLFAGFGLRPGPHLDGLIKRFAEAASAVGDDPGRFAAEAAEAELRAWFLDVLGKETVGEGSALLVGRAAYRACRAAERWPDALLARDVPAELVSALRAAVPVPVPPEQPATMLDQPFESWSLRDVVPKPRAVRLLPRRSAAA